VKNWKIQAEWFYGQNDFLKARQCFIKLSDHFFITGDTTRGIDYLNKCFNCSAQFDKNQAVKDFGLIFNYSFQETKKNTILIKSVFKTFFDNQSLFPTSKEKLDICNQLLSLIPYNVESDLIFDLLSFKLNILRKANSTTNSFFTYFDILRLNLSNDKKIQCLYDLASLLYDIGEYSFSNIILFSIFNDCHVGNYDKALIYNLIGNNYFYKNNLKTAYCFYDTSKTIRENYFQNSSELRVTYNNIANYFVRIKEYDKALDLYNLAFNNAKSFNGQFSREAAFECNNIGNLFFEQLKIDSAYKYYSNSHDILVNTNHFFDITYSLYNLGAYYFQIKEYNHSLDYLYGSLTTNNYNPFNASKESHILSIKDLIISSEMIGDVYFNKSQIDDQYFSHYIDSANFFYDLSINYIDSLLLHSTFELSQIHLNELYEKIINKRITSSFKSIEINSPNFIDTLRFISALDRKHNHILNIQTNSFSPFFFDTVTFNHQEKLLVSLESLESTKNFLFDSIVKFSYMIAEHLTKFEDYFIENHCTSKNPTTLNIINNYIDSLPLHKMILMLTEVDGCLYTVALIRGFVKFQRIENANLVINTALKCMSKVAKFENFYPDLATLSESILSPYYNDILYITNLVIITEPKLNNFPCDLLLIDNSCQSFPSYLITQCDISYAPSLSSLISTSKNKVAQFNYDYIGFAPGFSKSHDQITPYNLPLSQMEVKRISSLLCNNNFKCQLFLDSEASVDNLNLYSSKSRILHIATHTESSKILNLKQLLFLNSSSVNSLESWGYFDISILNNGPETVVLSTCNASEGKCMNNEGDFNLARAFLKIGTKNVIYSIFRVDDKFAYLFMLNLFSNFIELKNWTSSLRQTKKEFLHHQVYNNPYYWSSFNLIMQ